MRREVIQMLNLPALVIALVVAIPVALVVTGAAMKAASRYLERVKRWEHFCLGK
jgi:hypothetical protein